MENSTQKNLFEKYVAGNCTEEEKAIVESWYLSELKKSEIRPSAAKMEKAKSETLAMLFPKKIKFSLKKWIAYAAVVSIATFGIYKFQVSGTQQETNQARISNNVETENTLTASQKENSMVKLPDGSIVILNRGSKLVLFSSFGRADRRVKLIGKAFFDIKHQPSKPFVIYSGAVTTTVLGTSFDIDATPGAQTVTINVIRGKVKVERKNEPLAVLTKNMQVVYNNNTTEVFVNQVNAEKELSWNKQDLEFNDVSLEDARVRLENQFGYTIILKDAELGKQTFHYSMRAKESAESFFKSFCEFIEAAYTIDHKNKIISIQPLNQKT